MKYVNMRELRLNSTDVWDKLSREELVLTKNGKPFAILLPVNEKTVERDLALVPRLKALAALDEIHRKSVENKTHRVSGEEIEKEIKAVRKERRA